MFNANLIVLSYHRFGEEESDYPFSRTYKQFAIDIVQKDYDWVTVDDGMKSQIKACEIMREKNIRAKLFISTALVGEKGYCTWDEIWNLSRYHDIENHSHNHVNLTEIPNGEVANQIVAANELIKANTGRRPRYLVPPWNQANAFIEELSTSLGLTLVNNRINILNNTR